MYVLGRRNGAEKRENGHAANHRLTRYIMLAALFQIAPLIDILIFQYLTSTISQRTKCKCNKQVDVWFMRMHER